MEQNTKPLAAHAKIILFFQKKTRSNGPITGKVEPAKTTFKPWPKPGADVKAITGEWEEGLYLYDRGDYDTKVMRFRRRDVVKKVVMKEESCQRL